MSLWSIVHGLRLCRLNWFERRYVCASCDSGALT